MNFGYGDIYDYLVSDCRNVLHTAIAFDSEYFIEKTFKKAAKVTKAMMVLDFTLNFDGDPSSELVGAVNYFAGDDVLSSMVCGTPLVFFANRFGSEGAKAVFEGKPVSLDDEVEDDGSIGRIVEMFRLQLGQNQDSTSALINGLNFLKRTCLDEEKTTDEHHL